MEIAGFDVFERAKIIAIKIHRATKGFPKEEQYEIASQLRRSVVSIATNIAEGYTRKEAVNEYRYFLRIASGSTGESRLLIEFCKEFGHITEAEYEEYEAELEVISRQLYRLQKKLGTVN